MFVRRLAVSVVLMFCGVAAIAQVPGQNINMVSGTDWPAGDPYLQRQNEPSMAVSSRNPEHLLGGANDYRTVDIPNSLAPNILGDAWLGVYSSMDGGETWKSTLLPGYPQDTSPVGTASRLHSFTVATDPTVRAGTHGMFYYSGLAFNRGSNSPSGVFVATFQDQNNKGNGDAAILTKDNNGKVHGNPFSYIGVNMVDTGTSGQFLDKPWIVVDIPRSGRTATCKINGQTFSSGYVYVVYTQFNGSQNNPASKIKEVTSTNCGATWSMPQVLSQSQKLAQGTVAAIDPMNGNVYIAWRQIGIPGNQNQPDAIQYAVSTNGGASFVYEPAVYTFPAPTTKNPYPPGAAFDQPQATSTTFRSLDVPTMAVDANSRVWVAFSQRVNGPTAGTYGSRIIITTLPKGSTTWTAPYAADSNAPSTAYGHEFMPALNFAYGKMMLAWFDSRRDNLESVLQCPTGSTCTDLSQVTPVDVPIPGTAGTSGNVGGLGTKITIPSAIFTPYIQDPNSGVRHTIDIFGGVINPAGGPATFKGFQISQYPYYVDDANNQIEQGYFNPPNLPMFVQGTTPFMGDYIDIASQNILPSGTSWAFNTQATDSTGATNAPDFHVTWTDNRDVVPPPVIGNSQDWTQYVPPNGGNSSTSTYSGTGSACPTCTTVQPACSFPAGSSAAYTGDRNQNVYTSRISNGLVVRFKENAKPLNSVQRSFSLLVKNTVSPLSTTPLDSPSYYRILLGVTSTTQTPSCTVTGGGATLPGTPNCYLDVAINPKTTLTQAITVNSTSANPSINVLVAQEACIPGTTNCGNNPSFTGLQALAVVNGDASNPSVADPDFLTADNDNPDVETPYGALPIASGEQYDPTVDGPPDEQDASAGIFTPKIGVPAIFTPKIGTVANSAPAIATPTVFTPKITSIFTPKITSIQIANPTIVNTIFTPKIFTPKIFTPKIVSPDIFTPKITNLSDGSNGGTNPVTDYSWKVADKGNTSASYSTTEFAKSAGVNCCPASCNGSNPPSSCSSCSRCQLVQHKVYESPVANRDGSNLNATCDLTVQQQYITVANIPDPAFSIGTVGGGSASDPTTSTLSLSPGEGNRVTLRVVATPVSQTVGPFKTVATSFSTDKGQNQPAGSLTITTGALPVAVVGQHYTSTMLTSVGGLIPPGVTAVWSIPPDPSNPVAVTPPISPEPLPVAPLTLNQSGQISTDVVTQTPGPYTVNMQVQDLAPTPALDVQQVPLYVNQFTISNVNVAIPNEVGSTSYMMAGNIATVTVTVNNQGPATATSVAPTLTVNAVAGGTPLPGGPTPVVTCTGPTGSPMIAGNGTQAYIFTCTAGSGNGYVTFTANATGQYVNSPAATATAIATAVSAPAGTPSGTPPNVIVDNVNPKLTFNNANPAANPYGWNNTAVTFSYSTDDNLSGVNTSVPNPLVLATEGKNVTGQVTVTDYANNSATFTAPLSPMPAVNIDLRAPIITPSSTYTPNTWTNQNVTVQFNCTDNLSGPLYISGGITNPIITGIPATGATLTYSYNPQSPLTSIATVTLTAETPGTTLTANCQDFAGNNASPAQFGPIMIDKTPPALSASAVAGLNIPYAAGTWTNQNVTVSFACLDNLSTVANSGVASFAPAQQIFNTETSNGSSTGTCTDKAGNVSSVTFSPIMIDMTPPLLTVATANADSSAYTPGKWTNQSVTVTYSCNDNASPLNVNSGLATGSPTAPQTFTQETTGAGTGTTGTCSDKAGNIATNAPLSSGTILIDKTPPTVTATAALSPSGASYTAGTWTNQSVVVTFSCNDPLSGPQAGSLTGNTAFGTQGTYTANGSCQDVAGNTGNGSFGPVEIDTTTPSIMITAPTQTTYILNQPITPSYTCGDGGGDSVTCTPTPAGSPYNATPVGPATFSVHAVDQAGNATNPDPSVSYLVIYKFTGFQAPLQNAVMTPYPSGTYTPSDSGYFVAGATIPVAWQLQDYSNNAISDLTTLTSIVAYPNATCTGPATGNGTILYNSSTNTSAFSFPNNTFTFNWNTTGMAEGCYNLVVTTNDTAQWSTIVHLGQTFAVGTTPYAIAFDGTNMWVPAYGSNSVTELLASTGAVVGTYPVGAGPAGVFFDGTNIWVANTTDGTVTELSASTGATLGTFAVGSQPWGIAFDGTNIWVTNRSSNNVTKLLASTGAIVGTYAVGAGPYGIAFDGTNMWVANDYDGTVTELVASTGVTVGTYSVGASPVGVAFDGTNIWVADQTGGVGTVTKLAPTGAVIGTYAAGPAPNDILFDGTNIWVTNVSSNTVTELVASSGAVVGTYTIGTGPYGITFDHTNIWVTVPGSNTVTKLPVF